MSPEQSKKAGMVFLSAVVSGVDHQLDRQAGRLVKTDVVAPDPLYGWYFNIIDRPSQDDDLFDDELASGEDSEQREQWRTLKNEKSIRRVPVAPQLIELGLLRYVNWVREQGGVSFFPSLSYDWHDKLSGAPVASPPLVFAARPLSTKSCMDSAISSRNQARKVSKGGQFASSGGNTHQNRV